MALKCTYRKSVPSDALILSMKLREQDYHELQAMHGLDVDTKDLLERAMTISKECYTAELEGEVVFMFGVSVFNDKGNIGCPWLLGSDKVKSLGMDVTKVCSRYTKEWLDHFEGLVNFVDARNTTSIRWLKRLGYFIHDPMDMGAMRMPFHPFTKFRMSNPVVKEEGE